MSTPLITWDTRGETVAGRLIEIREGRAFADRTSRVAELERKDGRRVAFILTRYLEARFRELGIRPGHRMKLRYIGKRETPHSRFPVKQFEIEVRR